MSLPPFGRMRHRVALEAATRSPDGGGGAEETWSSVAELWADIRPLAGRENIIADAVAGTVTHEIVLRYRDDIRPAMRLRYGARLFDIIAAIDMDERRRRLKCLCQERGL